MQGHFKVNTSDGFRSSCLEHELLRCLECWDQVDKPRRGKETHRWELCIEESFAHQVFTSNLNVLRWNYLKGKSFYSTPQNILFHHEPAGRKPLAQFYLPVITCMWFFFIPIYSHDSQLLRWSLNCWNFIFCWTNYSVLTWQHVFKLPLAFLLGGFPSRRGATEKQATLFYKYDWSYKRHCIA